MSGFLQNIMDWCWLHARTIFAVLLIIVAASVFYLYNSSKNLASLPPPKQQEKVSEIIAAGDIGQCKRARGVVIDGVNYEAVCKNNIALQAAHASLDFSQCEKLDDNLMSIDDCKEKVLMEKLTKEQNISVCDMAPTQDIKTGCTNKFWIQKALAGQDEALCGNVTPEFQQWICKDSVALGELKSPNDIVALRCGDLSSFAENDCGQLKSLIQREGATKCEGLFYPPILQACARLKNAAASQ